MLLYIKKRLIPVLNLINLFRSYYYDFRRFLSYSGFIKRPLNSILTNITSEYHTLEKGLSSDNGRFGFGQPKVRRLMEILIEYRQRGGRAEDSQYLSAIAVLKNYSELHLQEKKCFDKNLKILLEDIGSFLENNQEEGIFCGTELSGGKIDIDKNKIVAASKGDFLQLSQNRYSIRTFSNEDVSMETIREIIKLAQKSPSTCNRQTTRIYVYSDKAKINEILQLHGGTKGFTEQINKVLIVTGDLSCCLSPGDRHQIYVDPAIFAMNILYGLQYKGLGGCMLHWSVNSGKDKKLRKIVDIKKEHTVICMVAIGHLKDNFKVANSQRKPLDEILFEN